MMKPSCERCSKQLDPDRLAFICSFECTFCSRCANERERICPNCGGELVARPRRRTATINDHLAYEAG